MMKGDTMNDKLFEDRHQRLMQMKAIHPAPDAWPEHRLQELEHTAALEEVGAVDDDLFATTEEVYPV